MAPSSTLRDEPLGPGAVHLCVDMQRLFLPGTEWGLDWMPRVLPRVVALCEPAPEALRLHPLRPGAPPGRGPRHLGALLDAVGLDDGGGGRAGNGRPRAGARPLRAPPAEVADKPVYSPWLGSDLHARLQRRGCAALVVTGGETDMCVLAAVLGAADLGYRTILVSDAVCSASDAAHDAMLGLFSDRYGQHVEIGLAEEVLELWPPGRRRC